LKDELALDENLNRLSEVGMLAKLLAPLSQHDFFERYWTRQFLHLPGPPAKFAEFFDWEVLNRCLEQHRFPPKAAVPRLALFKGGKPVETRAYLNGDTIDSPRLVAELSNGATLILNFADQLHRPLRDLCAHLETIFHVDVFANLYAGWRHDHGFAVHWDDQDTLILQVYGRKSWRVWPATRAYPFKHDLVDTSPKTKPEGPPVWEGVLEQGGLLSIPRGWWHVAYPMDEPCLHLTVTTKNLNGVDLLKWLANEMKASETARMELPLVASAEERRAWLDDVRRALIAACTDDLLDRYLTHIDRQARPRPSISLPSLDARPAVVTPTMPLQLTLSRPLQFETINGTSKFFAAGEHWHIASELVPVLARFNDGLPHTASEVSLHGTMSPEAAVRLTAMLTMLVMKGVMRPVAS
jgi:ribosomal protein L16 Arg81 hydroxylase